MNKSNKSIWKIARKLKAEINSDFSDYYQAAGIIGISPRTYSKIENVLMDPDNFLAARIIEVLENFELGKNYCQNCPVNKIIEKMENNNDTD